MTVLPDFAERKKGQFYFDLVPVKFYLTGQVSHHKGQKS